MLLVQLRWTRSTASLEKRFATFLRNFVSSSPQKDMTEKCSHSELEQEKNNSGELNL